MPSSRAPASTSPAKLNFVIHSPPREFCFSGILDLATSGVVNSKMPAKVHSRLCDEITELARSRAEKKPEVFPKVDVLLT